MLSLYMFALMPPPALTQRIEDERRNFAEDYKAVKALKPPVHITLYEPFKDLPEAEQDIIGLTPWVERQQPFELELKNFNFFRHSTSPVVYIDVVKNEQLALLHRNFITELKKYTEVEKRNGSYTPHITIGYRDLPVAIFPEIMSVYSRKRFSAKFEVNAIYFWKHDGKNWQILHTFKMGVQPQTTQSSLF